LNLPHDIVIAEYNDIAATWPLINKDVGAIIVEPLQSAGGIIPATHEFLQFLRDAATAFDIVLIFDEIVTSRLHYHGLQGHWGITPDITTLGKYIGGGFSFGCFGGKSDIMDQFDPRNAAHLAHSGTYNNNIFTMLAGIAGMKLVTAEEITRINVLGDRTREGIRQIVQDKDLHDIKAVGFGSAVGLKVQGSMQSTIKDVIYFHLLRQGIMIARRGFLMFNLMHTDEHVDRLLACFRKTIEYITTT
jgi:glutamate-1-semialdehyde 2,1-aminomutase